MRLRLPRPATLQAFAITLTGLSSIAWLPVVGAPYMRFAFVLLSAAAWLVVWAGRGLERLDGHRRMLTALLAVACVAVVVSALRSRFPGIALTYGGSTSVSAAYWISLFVIMGAASRVTLGPATLRALQLQFAWIVPVAVIGSVQQLITGTAQFGFRNADYFAPMMLLAIPLALALAARPGAAARGWRVVAGVLTAAVLAAGTVSGLLGLAAMSLFTVVFAPALVGLTGRARTAVIAVLGSGLIAFVLVAVAFLAGVFPPSVDRALESSVFGASAATRVEMWRVAGIEIYENLATGVGADQYAYEGQRYFSKRLFQLEHDVSPDAALPVDPHSIIFLIPVEFGVLGLTTLLLIALTWAHGVMRTAFRSQEGFGLRWAFALGALGFGYATMFTPFPLLFGGMPLMFGGLALVRPPAARPWPEADRFAAPRWVAAGAAVVLAMVIAGSAVGGWYISRRSASLLDTSSGPAAAARLQPRIAYYRYAQLWQEGRLLARADGVDAQREYQAAVDAAPLEIRGYAPYLVELVRLSTEAARNTGRTDLSWEIARLREAQAASPALPEAALELAHAHIAAGDLRTARAILDRSEEWRRVVPLWDKYRKMVDSPPP